MFFIAAGYYGESSAGNYAIHDNIVYARRGPLFNSFVNESSIIWWGRGFLFLQRKTDGNITEQRLKRVRGVFFFHIQNPSKNNNVFTTDWLAVLNEHHQHHPMGKTNTAKSLEREWAFINDV